MLTARLELRYSPLGSPFKWAGNRFGTFLMAWRFAPKPPHLPFKAVSRTAGAAFFLIAWPQVRPFLASPLSRTLYGTSNQSHNMGVARQGMKLPALS